MSVEKDTVAVIGAGMGGLAAAIRLAAAGRDVTVYEAHGWPGGKVRVVASDMGPVDAGPTVLTLRHVLDELFAAAGEDMAHSLTLDPLPVLARHYWADGTTLDLLPDAGANAARIGAAFGARAQAEFTRFERETRALFDAFRAPVMERARPDALGAARAALARPHLLPWLRPGRSLHDMLRARFSDPHLRQLFGRYATYVGGNPLSAPAVLGLIWQAEAAGVWTVRGGMAALAQALAGLLERCGGRLRLNTPVAAILTQGGQVTGLRLSDGTEQDCGQVVFNGDPAALPALLDAPRRAPPRRQTHPRSLSAHVWTIAGRIAPRGLGREALAYHTVFFADDPGREFGPLARGTVPRDPTIYVCAQDRAHGMPDGPERFQFILNAPPLHAGAPPLTEPPCNTDPFQRLARFGLHLDAQPSATPLTTPARFARLFPHSMGALYGLSPNGALATFLRPGTRTRLTGLYLAGGGVHPGAGVPMALSSGRHAAEAAQRDRISARRFRPMAMPGGISTGSAMTGNAPSR
ncbi:MAG: phytoene desaturase [Rhodobacteraceae bacterium]|nr:MAG: phytoene desaturase [Paracoccaceae bacterium]